jgi:dTDP-4-dehydrorhamnose 3,5-epimerase
MSALPDGAHVIEGPPIHDLQIVALRRIPDERGTIMHMLRADDPHFTQFGEIYFTTLYKDVVKGWHIHQDMTLNYACIHGRIKLAVYDPRPDSPTRGSLVEVYLGPDSHLLAIIPPGLANGIKGLQAPHSLLANCASHTHQPGRTSRIDPFDNDIPYDWGVQNH